MRFVVLPDVEAVARAGAEATLGAWSAPGASLIAASGASPEGIYRRLAEHQGALKSARLIKLDEWLEIGADDPASCEMFMTRHLRRPLRISDDRYLSFDPAADPAAECARVTKAMVAWGAADVGVLGVGRNGHVGFNEPAATLRPVAHVVDLSEASRGHAMVAGRQEPPRQGVTLGMAEILSPKRLVVVITGAHKRQVLAQLRRPEVTPAFPASFLWLHPDTLCLADADAWG